MEAAFAVQTSYYNWCRRHSSLGMTRAMKAGLATRAWSVADLIGLLEAEENAVVGTETNKRGPYKPRKPRTI